MSLVVTPRTMHSKTPPAREPGRRSQRPLSQVEHIKPHGEAKTVFLRSLATMVTAGVTIDKALEYLGAQTEDPKLATICDGMAYRVHGGYPLSQAMACYPRAFSRLQLRLVQMGEKTGLLDKVLNELSRYEEKERELLLKVKSTVSYPSFILVVATLMMIFVPPFILKGMFGLIQGSGVEPPLLTVIVMKVTDFLRTPLFYFLFAVFVALLVWLFPLWLRNPNNQRRLAQVVIKLPGIGRVYHTLGVARFARAFAVQIDCGMNPLGALPISAEVTDNPILIDKIKEASSGLSQGESFSVSLEATGFFPRLMINMVQAGEESAQLGELLQRTAEMYEAEVEHALDTFTALLEPMIMCGIGVMVGILVLATMLPMTQVIENLH